MSSNKVFRVDMSLLSAEQRLTVRGRLKGISFMVLDRRDAHGIITACDVIGCSSADEIISAAQLPDGCAVADITGWDLLQ